MNRHGRFGRNGEDEAIRVLKAAGYRIVARNVRLPGGEIDIICKDKDVVVFVEVKTRAGGRFGSALAAVDARKRRTLRALAADWLQFSAPLASARFDIVTVEPGRTSHHPRAFA